MSTIEQNLQAVRDSIAQAAADAQRAPADVTLLAVSKTFGADAVLAAMRAGQAAFGENYLQEALDKIALVTEAAPQHVPAWHFIGPIQSNKTRPIAEHFDWVHTVEREKIAVRLSEQRPAGLPDLNICLQVNISGEASKSGVTPADLPALARRGATAPLALARPDGDSRAGNGCQPSARCLCAIARAVPTIEGRRAGARHPVDGHVGRLARRRAGRRHHRARGQCHFRFP